MNLSNLPSLKLTLDGDPATLDPLSGGRIRATTTGGKSQIFTCRQIIDAVRHRQGRLWTHGSHPMTDLDRRVFGHQPDPPVKQVHHDPGFGNPLSRALGL